VDPDKALANEPDLVVELMGGADYPAELMRAALRSGAHVVTANKAALASHYDALHACAASGDAVLAYSASVGGGTPILETVARLKQDGGLVALQGVMNGTANFLLGQLAQGKSFDAAVLKAQELGFAEADPSTDVDGHDAADKLSLLIREAFGVAITPGAIPKGSLRDVTARDAQAALGRGEVLKQVSRCRLLPDGRVEAEVRIASLPAAHPLAGAVNEENRFLVTDEAGKVHLLCGKGAGRWPTAAAVFADIMDVQRALLMREAAEPAPSQAAPLRLSA
jgi:homoserine dehydrogenase